MGGGVLHRNANGGLPTVLVVWRDIGVGMLSRRMDRTSSQSPLFFHRFFCSFDCVLMTFTVTPHANPPWPWLHFTFIVTLLVYPSLPFGSASVGPPHLSTKCLLVAVYKCRFQKKKKKKKTWSRDHSRHNHRNIGHAQGVLERKPMQRAEFKFVLFSIRKTLLPTRVFQSGNQFTWRSSKSFFSIGKTLRCPTLPAFVSFKSRDVEGYGRCLSHKFLGRDYCRSDRVALWVYQGTLLDQGPLDDCTSIFVDQIYDEYTSGRKSSCNEDATHCLCQ